MMRRHRIQRVARRRADRPTLTENAYAAQMLLRVCDAAAWAEIARNESIITRCTVGWPRLLRDFRSDPHTVGAVRVHTHNIYRKLQVNSRAEAVRAARAAGIGGE